MSLENARLESLEQIKDNSTPAAPPSGSNEYTYSQVSEHETKGDLWMVIHDKIYNASKFIDEHPYVSSPKELSLHIPLSICEK